mgnify:FL=1
MSEKSHVGMGHSLCPVCGAKHDEVVLLHKYLQPVLARDTALGWDLCPEHKKMHPEFVALVECKDQPTSLNDADRTGWLAHVRRAVWENIFNTPPPPGPMAFVEEGVIETLLSMQGS